MPPESTLDFAVNDETAEYDAIIVGAGFSGLYLLQRLRAAGLSARVYDAASEVGGTWYWNRYPGARSDSESTVYCYSDHFSPELSQEWEWSERFPAQPEILKYLTWVADRLDLRRDISFDTRVTSAGFEDETNQWVITTDSGARARARVLLPAVGALSAPLIPDYPGMDEFSGQLFHTARMPADIDFTGKRVAIIGNGATAIQIVPEVARVATHVFEFQRNPYHALPGRNHPLDADDWQEIHAHHPEIWRTARENFGGFPYGDFLGEAGQFTPQQRRQIFEECWNKGGFTLMFDTFSDVVHDKAVNDEYLDFLRTKIAGIVRDPKVAGLLTPKVPFVTKRPPLEHGYYAAFNRDNVTLVDIKASPIERFTPTGVRISDGDSHTEYDVDIIVLATGFDAWTGSLLNLNIHGRAGVALSEAWMDGPRTFVGLAVHGFPNMFLTYCGPFNPVILSNGPSLIEQQGEWITNCLRHMREAGIDYVEARPDAEEEFLQTHRAIADATLIPTTDSWWTGTNVGGKTRTMLGWCGTFPEYRRLCDEAAAKDYQGFITRSATERPVSAGSPA